LDQCRGVNINVNVCASAMTTSGSVSISLRQYYGLIKENIICYVYIVGMQSKKYITISTLFNKFVFSSNLHVSSTINVSATHPWCVENTDVS